MTYLAKCPGTDCTTAEPTTLNWFKINHAGLNPDGTWVSDTIIADNNTWTVTIPSDIAPGPYLVRHELVALHSASNANGAQFYPMCANLKITGTGSAAPTDTVKFPGAYSPTDPGILVNIYYPVLTNYTIPGPAPYVSGGASGPVPSSTAPSSAPAASSISAGPRTPILSPSTTLPCSNDTRTHSEFPKTTQSVGSPPRELTPAGEAPNTPTRVAAVPTDVPPVVSTVIQTVGITQVITMTVPAVETVTVTQSRPGGQAPECTPIGRYRRSIYG